MPATPSSVAGPKAEPKPESASTMPTTAGKDDTGASSHPPPVSASASPPVNWDSVFSGPLPASASSSTETASLDLAAISIHDSDEDRFVNDYESEREDSPPEKKMGGAEVVHPYNDARVIAGQGTIGFELLEQAPELDAIVVPTSGGGMLTGIALAAKAALGRAQKGGGREGIPPRKRDGRQAYACLTCPHGTSTGG